MEYCTVCKKYGETADTPVAPYIINKNNLNSNFDLEDNLYAERFKENYTCVYCNNVTPYKLLDYLKDKIDMPFEILRYNYLEELERTRYITNSIYITSSICRERSRSREISRSRERSRSRDRLSSKERSRSRERSSNYRSYLNALR